MTTRDFTANVISATKVVPDGNFKNSKASGVWDINEALDLIKGGNWPNAANIDPASFVDGLFQTHVFDTTGAELSIDNGIDLSNKGGLVWLKSRSNAVDHELFDTERGVNKILYSNATTASTSSSLSLTSFNTNGFTLNNNLNANVNNRQSVAWTFRKQPKFFDVVTYTGTGSAQAISHSLNSTVGMIAVKRTDTTGNWAVYHRGANGGTDPEDYHAGFNLADEFANNAGYWNDTAPTTTQFTVGDDNNVNASSGTYVAYLFAHNNNDGGFGESEDQDIIKCGYYTGNTSTKPSIDLGFEPQWLMIKNASSANQDWQIVDNIRGLYNGTGVSGSGGVQDARLRPNQTNAEETTFGIIDITPTGFKIGPDQLDETNKNGDTIVYMAIRRGGMETPTTPSDVFAIDQGINQSSADTQVFDAGFPVDILFRTRPNTTYNNLWLTRLTGESRYLLSNSNAAEQSTAYGNRFDSNTGIISQTTFDWSQHYAWMWKRARGFCDVVTYSGTGSARTVSHNLDAVPEMMWIKMRSSTQNWAVYHKGANDGTDPEDYGLELNSSSAEFNTATYFNDTAPTSTVFTVGNGGAVNSSGETYVAFLFASISGLCKIGSYTGNSSSTQDIDCGFTNGAKMVILKQASHSEAWEIYDTTRGLVAGNDNRLRLNTDSAEATNSDFIDPLDSGFTAVADSNFDGRRYIFYAIANDPS